MVKRAAAACWLLLGAMAVCVSTDGTAAPNRDVSMLLESRAAVRRGLLYLKGAQAADGSWCADPAVTALVATAMLGSGEQDLGLDSDCARRALDFVRRFGKPDGGIYDRYYASYSTSLCSMALLEAGSPEDREMLRRARAYLLGAQADESEDIASDDLQYGGWGYEAHQSGEGMQRADLSNTQFALEAIRALEDVAEEDRDVAGTGQGTQTRTELAYDRAIEFLQRCQNLKATNDQDWAGNDGGFVYHPGESKAGATPEGGLRSYGGMTYAGLKSMVYARLERSDPRVLAAFDWAQRHWSVVENPGLGQQGLYYYYLTMARALNAYGAEAIIDAEERPHDWRRELTGQLLKVQRADGSWVNENGRWMEQIPELVTAYAVLALEHASAGW